MVRSSRRSKPARTLMAGLRVLVAVLMLVILPSRPAMGCWSDGTASEPATSEEARADGCCDGEHSEQQDEHGSECPCPEKCPPGCTLGCGLIATFATAQPSLVAAPAIRAQFYEPTARPVPGVRLDILHVPR